ncbi:hypothetical protein [Nonomuraea sp. NPDC048826]|uniref:hypothetical protein n=1 Tax=Nonomuraea sp. NPDC048826 TaxID=3364347 RepID=UPI00372349C6
MKSRAPLLAILAGLLVAAVVTIGFVRVAASGPELGGPVVVSNEPPGNAEPTEDAAIPEPTEDAAIPEPTEDAATPQPTESTATPAPETPASEDDTPEASARTPSVSREAKAEPVRPPSPRPGGDDDDDDGDDHGDDDGDDGDDD